MFLVEVGLHQLDTEVPLNLQHELKDIDGIDFQFATEQRLIVAQILRSHIGDPQALKYNGFKLFLYGWHNACWRQYSTALRGCSYITMKPCATQNQPRIPSLRSQPDPNPLQNSLLKSSIDSDYLSGNVACLLGSQKYYQRRHFFGHAEAPQRNFRE